jgi:hypothetical protein
VVDLGHVRDERRLDPPSSRRQLTPPAKQLLVGQFFHTNVDGHDVW